MGWIDELKIGDKVGISVSYTYARENRTVKICEVTSITNTRRIRAGGYEFYANGEHRVAGGREAFCTTHIRLIQCTNELIKELNESNFIKYTLNRIGGITAANLTIKWARKFAALLDEMNEESKGAAADA